MERSAILTLPNGASMVAVTVECDTVMSDRT